MRRCTTSRTLRGGSFSGVSEMFRPCNRLRESLVHAPEAPDRSLDSAGYGGPVSAPAGQQTYAGQRLGLPPQGRGAVAGWLRRIAALFVDWIASLLVAGAIVGEGAMSSHDWRAWVPMLVFFVQVS